MKKENMEFIESREFFQLTLNVPNSQVPIAELIEYLRNTDKLFKSINQTLNEKYTIGFREVSLEVTPFEEGSFQIPIWIKKINPTTIAECAIGGFIGGLGVLLVQNQHGSVEVPTKNSPVVVDTTELIKNKSTADALSNIATLTLHDNKIEDLSVTYENPQGKHETVKITKTVLEQVAQNQKIDDESSIIQTNVRLEIVSPVFSSEPASWRVSVNGGAAFSARMEDMDFLETMGAKKIAFAKGDAIVADIEIKYAENGVGIRPKHYIRKVHSYPRYQKITRTKIVEKDLFDDGDTTGEK